MTTARLHRVNVILIVFPDFEWPSSVFVENYAAHVEGILSLAVHGIGVEMVQETLRWVVASPQTTLPLALSLSCVNAVVAKVTGSKQGPNAMASVPGIALEEPTEERFDNVCISHSVTNSMQTPSSIGVRVVSIVDHHVQESVSAALLLQELLTDFFH